MIKLAFRLALIFVLFSVVSSKISSRDGADSSSSVFESITTAVTDKIDDLRNATSTSATSGGQMEAPELPSEEEKSELQSTLSQLWGNLSSGVGTVISDTPDFLKPGLNTPEEIDPSEGDAAVEQMRATDPVFASLVVSPELGYREGYVRELFGDWSDVNGSGCTTRQDAIKESVVEIWSQPDRCWVKTGIWYSTYDDVTFEGSSSDVDADHVVALAEAWDSGADTWDADRRAAFYNDRDNIRIVTRASNSAKSAFDAAEWLPSNTAALCDFASTVVSTKAKWGLSVDADELRTLASILVLCG